MADSIQHYIFCIQKTFTSLTVHQSQLVINRSCKMQLKTED